MRNLTGFGAFVEIEEGIDGLLHVSDMSWTKKIMHPSAMLQKGDEIEAVVLSTDPDSQRVSLGLKQLEEDPWEKRIPERYRSGMRPLPFAPFLEIAASTYASRRDRQATPYRRRMAAEFQRAYLDVVRAAARISGWTPTVLLDSVARRSAVINRFDRITGDSATYATRRLLRSRGKLSVESVGWLIEQFVEAQDLSPPDQPGKRGAAAVLQPDVKRILDALLELVAELRHGL